MLHPADIFFVSNMKYAVDDTKNSCMLSMGDFGEVRENKDSVLQK